MKQLSILGMPMGYGQPFPGVDLGPKAIRYAGVIERVKKICGSVEDLGDLYMVSHAFDISEADIHLKNGPVIAENANRLADAVEKIVQKGSFPLILGGDHSLSIGTIAGLAKHTQNLGVIWFDAHGDINTDKTTPSGNIHGMPLAASLGMGHPLLTEIGGYSPKIQAENIVMIGVRELDEGEKHFIKEKNIRVYTIREIDRLGIASVIEETIAYLKEKTDGVHLSFDLDSIDPDVAPGVGTPAPGGLTYREGRLAMEMLSESGIITSAEFVEVNPLLDVKNKTAILAADLISALFGERIL